LALQCLNRAISGGGRVLVTDEKVGVSCSERIMRRRSSQKPAVAHAGAGKAAASARGSQAVIRITISLVRAGLRAQPLNGH
jgi:hypothetical protein